MLSILVNENVNNKLFDLWKKHYDTMNISYNIIDNISQLLDNDTLITEYDFLFKYSKNEEDTMILNKNLTEEDLKKSCLVGRVFSVPIKNRLEYTSFEIPDFILYKHHDHTNYTKNGIKIFFNKKNIHKHHISDDIVCFSMLKSDVAFENEYYETNIIYGQNNFNNKYFKNSIEIIVNKKLKYAILWHAKCASSTICEYFAKYNNIYIDNAHIISKTMKKYRWNNYLQNIDIISFIRHPYLRFISTFFNKHINKMDYHYLTLFNYNEYLKLYDDNIYNFTMFIKYKHIDGHTHPHTTLYYNNYTNLKNIEYHDIENGVNYSLHNFFSKYHDIDNIQINYKNITDKSHTYELNPQYKYYNYDDWVKYKILYKIYPNYLSILDDELKNILYEIYKDEIIKYGQFFINKIHDNIDINKIKSNNDLNNLKNLLPLNFSCDMYRALNLDLNNLIDTEAKLHYINHGIKENRIYKYDIDKLPFDFSCDMYRECNLDLKTLNDIEAKLHYINHGKNELRKYKYDINKLPNDFSCDMYRECNSDLETLNDIECKLHYINHGIKENRKYN